MEDIICPECGRPNLVEAKKCWYCQTSLEDIKNAEESEPFINQSFAKNDDEVDHDLKSKAEDDRPLPDWLKRIRELKEADQPPEEQDPNWQQENLFNTESNPPKETKSSSKNTSKPQNSNQKETKKEVKDDAPTELIEEKPYVYIRKESREVTDTNSPEPIDQEEQDLSTDLPAGFTKL